MAWQFDMPSWAAQAGSLVGAGGLGMIVLRVIDRGFGRAKQKDDDQALRRGELRQQIATLTMRVDLLTERLDASRDRNEALVALNAELRAENTQLRERYHRFMNWISTEPTLPQPPPWVYGRVAGPTAPSDQVQS